MEHRSRTLVTWRSTGRYLIPFVKVGRAMYYKKSDLDAWLEAQKRRSLM
nr:helix-turn-helix domain-containing protein [uncultured Pseudogulbenkiania sp.]